MEQLSTGKQFGGLRGMSRKTFMALSVRNFRLFFIGQSISQIGTWLTSVAAILLVLHPDPERARRRNI